MKFQRRCKHSDLQQQPILKLQPISKDVVTLFLLQSSVYICTSFQGLGQINRKLPATGEQLLPFLRCSNFPRIRPDRSSGINLHIPYVVRHHAPYLCTSQIGNRTAKFTIAALVRTSAKTHVKNSHTSIQIDVWLANRTEIKRKLRH